MGEGLLFSMQAPRLIDLITILPYIDELFKTIKIKDNQVYLKDKYIISL